MKRILLAIVALGVLTSMQAQITVNWNTGEMDVKVEYFTPTIVRIVKTPTGSESHQPSLVVLAKPENVSITEKGKSVTSGKLEVKLDPKTGALTFADSKGHVLLKEKNCTMERLTTGGNAGEYAVGQTFTLQKGEAIYGLGTFQDGKLNRRGAHKLMEQSNLEDFQNVLQSVNGWGLYWDNYSPTQFDDDANGMTLHSQVGDRIDYYFMLGGSADGVIAQMRHLTGDVPMFPLWTFGYWQSKERYKTSDELLSVVSKYRELHVPLDGIIQDWQYWGSNYLWNAMDFLSEDFAQGAQMVKKAHDMNTHLMISIWASFGPMTKAYRQLAEKDLLFTFQTWPQSGLTSWPPRMEYPSGVRVYDAFSAEARDIYWQNLKTLYDYDIDAWWMDSTDPDCFYPTDKDYDRKAGIGGTWRSLRNAFPLETVRGVYQKQREVSSNKRIFIMTRSSFAGQQHYGSNMWSGDVSSSWDMLRKQVPAGLNFTLTGNPNFNTDIGGFFCSAYNTQGAGSAPRNPQFQELYVRWMQYGLFCPVFRSHGADAPREIWQFGQKGEPIYDAIEKTIRLRYRLIPYLYSTAWQVTSANESYMRPLISDFAEDKRVWDMADEFMLGRSILTAPILEPQYTEERIIKEDAMTGWDRKEITTDNSVRAVDWKDTKTTTKYLPHGTRWYDFWTGKAYNGGQSITLKTTIDRTPMFIKAGSILPLGPEMEYVGQTSWENLEIRIYPGTDGTFTLYEDEGDGYNYEKGVYATITFTWNDSKRTLTIGQRQGSYPGMLSNRHFTVILPDGSSHKVNYDGTQQDIKL